MIGELGYSPKDLIYLIIMRIIGICNVFDMFPHENLSIPMFRMKTYKNMNKSNGSYENIANTWGTQINIFSRIDIVFIKNSNYQIIYNSWGCLGNSGVPGQGLWLGLHQIFG